MSVADDLAALKQMCAEGETEEEHDTHKAELEAAYLALQQESGVASPSNPASGETALEAHIVVQGDMNS